jgi:hypothetical protein
MNDPECPAACLRADGGGLRRRGTGPADRGVPAPAMLSAAIGAGRHDAVLMITLCAIGGFTRAAWH